MPVFFDINTYKNGKYPQGIKSEIDKYIIKASVPDNSIKLFGQQITDFISYIQD